MKVHDSFSDLTGGMNGGMLSTMLPVNQYARGINITCRDGVIATRPPFIEITLASEEEGVVAAIQQGKFQGMYTWQYGDTAYIVFAVSGEVYIMDPVIGAIFVATTVPGAFNEYVDRIHFCQVEEYLVVQDGLNLAMIVTGPGVARKAIPGNNEVPTGTVMAYCHGRLFVKTTDRGFVAGDIHMPNTPLNVLAFTETQYLAGGGAFFTPADLGNITAMTWAQSYGTATSQGPLLVLCERGIASYAVYAPRLQWQDLPIEKIEPGGNGCASEFGVVRMNEDLLFVGWHGLEDMSLLSTEAATQHRMTSLSTEVKPFQDLETPWMLPFVHAARFDDRLLYTAIGDLCTALDTSDEEVDDYRFTGLVALDFSPKDGIGSIGMSMKPAYDGIWTGVHPMGLASGVFDFEERCFVMGKDDDGTNHLYELMKTQGHDGGNIPIPCSLYTRSMPFMAYDREYPRPVPFLEKILGDASIWIAEFQESLNITLGSCPDLTMHVHDLSTIRIDAPMFETTAPFAAGYPQSRPKQVFPSFTEQSCEMISGKAANRGFEMQFRLNWAGIVKIHKFMIMAEAAQEVRNLACNLENTVLTGPPPDDYSYDMEA